MNSTISTGFSMSEMTTQEREEEYRRAVYVLEKRQELYDRRVKGLKSRVNEGVEREQALKREMEAQRKRHRQVAFENARLAHELSELQKHSTTDNNENGRLLN